MREQISSLENFIIDFPLLPEWKKLVIKNIAKYYENS